MAKVSQKSKRTTIHYNATIFRCGIGEPEFNLIVEGKTKSVFMQLRKDEAERIYAGLKDYLKI